MISGNRNRNIIITKIEGKLARANELFVLPAGVIRIGHHPRKKLRDFVEIILIFFEIFITGASPNFLRVVDLIIPLDFELNTLSRLERPRQIDSHHGVDHGIIQCFPAGIRHRLKIVAPIVGFHGFIILKPAKGEFFKAGSGST